MTDNSNHASTPETTRTVRGKAKTLGQSQPVNFRVEPSLTPMLQSWLEKNPGFTMSQLANLALRSFITKPFQTEPVTVEYLSKKDAKVFALEMMEEHADAMERLK